MSARDITEGKPVTEVARIISAPAGAGAEGYAFLLAECGKKLFVPVALVAARGITYHDVGAQVLATYVAQTRGRYLCTHISDCSDETSLDGVDEILAAALDALDEAMEALDLRIDEVRKLCGAREAGGVL